MFPTSYSAKVMAVCVAAMMVMMMMTEVTAMPKAGGHSTHSVETHKMSSDDAAVKMVTLKLDQKALSPSGSIRPLQNFSISPWTYNISRDDSLSPPWVSEARCLLRGCRDSKGQEDLSLESRPIMHHVLMLRRVKSTGTEHSYHYRLESRLIAVGCTCVRPTIQHQD
ncbi:interleukin 17a/f1 [Plectropomus leopardus]|uniref:interleukin 17a/f1 n=1 Tax=Plectropomus leopardus TaxID=160734 RepID=UPI001C4B58D6|nr:interleukin 17a/f1 [Plectropomus leopardus]